MVGLIGALRGTLGLDTADWDRGLTRAERRAQTSRNRITKELGGIRRSISNATTGLVSIATIGAITALTKRALNYASSLGEVSQQLGVTTRDLQVFRFAASQVGISQEEMDKGLMKLRVTMGQVAVGAAAPTKALEALQKGLSQAVKGKDTGEQLRLIAEALSKVSDSSKRAAVEVALFGRTGAKLDTLLTGGRKGIDELAQAAEKLGIVLSDEDIQNADETADKLAAVKQVLEARIAGVVAKNADAILGLATSLANLTSAIANFWGSNPERAMTLIGGLGGAALGSRLGPLGALGGGMIGAITGSAIAPDPSVAAQRKKQEQIIANARKEIARIDRPGLQFGPGGLNQNRSRFLLNDRIKRAEQALARLPKPVSTPKPAPAPPAGGGIDVGNFLAPKGGGGKGKKDNTAEELERKRIEALRDTFQFESDLRSEKMNELQVQQDLAVEFDQRAALALQIKDLEDEEYRAQLKLAVDTGDLSQARADELQKAHDKVSALERERIAIDKAAEKREFTLRATELGLELELDRLGLEAGLADTARERREIELRILDAAYKQEKAKLESIIAEQKLGRATQEAADEAQRRLDALNANIGLRQQGVMQGTRGPLEEYRNGLPFDPAKLNEALQNVAVNGLQALEDGIIAVIDGTKSLAGAFRDMATQIIAELLRIQIQRMIIEPVSNFLSTLLNVAGAAAGSISGGSNIAGSGTSKILSGKNLPGLASGGLIRIGGRAGVDRNLLSVNGMPVARVSASERIAIVPNNDNQMGGSPIHIHINARMTEREARMTGMQAARAAREELARNARVGG